MSKENYKDSQKWCNKCKRWLPFSSFNKGYEKYNQKLRTYCKNCDNASARKWQVENKERNIRNKRNNNLKRYGIDLDQYTQILEEQNGKCKICKSTEANSGGRYKHLAVDHDHKTGMVRGLLCNKCNRAIGLFGDSVELLKSATEYLDAYNRKSNDGR